MPVRVSYKKQLTFFLMLFVVVLVVFEGFARLYEEYNLPYTCDVTKSEANLHLDLIKRKQICHDFREMAYYNEPIHHIVPNQHFVPKLVLQFFVIVLGVRIFHRKLF